MYGLKMKDVTKEGLGPLAIYLIMRSILSVIH